MQPVKSANHRSAHQYHEKVESRIKEEIEDGNYIPVQEYDVTIVSPSAALPKGDGDICIIHDLSFTKKTSSLNDYAIKEECIYETLKQTLPFLQPHTWMAKCDLKWAYRSKKIKPEHSSLTGLQWTFKGNRKPTTLIDTAFPFGARKSPAHFNCVTQAMRLSL